MSRRGHECLGDCGRRVKREHACPACWTRLPESLRRAVATARRKTQAYSIALYEAHEWLSAHREAEADKGRVS